MLLFIKNNANIFKSYVKRKQVTLVSYWPLTRILLLNYFGAEMDRTWKCRVVHQALPQCFGWPVCAFDTSVISHSPLWSLVTTIFFQVQNWPELKWIKDHSGWITLALRTDLTISRIDLNNTDMLIVGVFLQKLGPKRIVTDADRQHCLLQIHHST